MLLQSFTSVVAADTSSALGLFQETAPPAERYKISTGSNGKGAIAVSPDGIHGWVNATKNLAAETHARWDTRECSTRSAPSSHKLGRLTVDCCCQQQTTQKDN